MNRILLTLISVLFVVAALFAGDGSSATSPLTVQQAKAKNVSTTTKYWLTGYVVGEMSAYSNSKWFVNMAPPFDGSVFLLADNPKEQDFTKCICLQFPTSSNGAEQYSLDENPQFWRKKVLLQGTREQYNNLDGFKKITDFQCVSSDMTNEAQLWDFFETFEQGEFTPRVATDKWQGGVYEVREYADRHDNVGTVVSSWQLHNAIVDDGKPKWDDQCLSLRNANAYAELTTDRSEGIGEVEFWAGNHENYKAAQLSFTLSVSVDQGESWTNIVTNQQVSKSAKATTNGMSLYRYDVNVPGRVRIRITKTDSNTGMGLQIDDLKMSRYSNHGTAINSPENDDDALISVQNNQVSVIVPYPQNISVYTPQGQCLMQKNEAETLNIFLPQGIYILRTNSTAQKFVVK